MTTRPSGYTRLLEMRADLFPSFLADQAQAAGRIGEALEPLIVAGSFSHIVDLGCGTGEILAGVQKRASALGRQIQCVGVDADSAEIERAASTCQSCRFVQATAERAVRMPLSQEIVSSRSEWCECLVLCVGHTLPHFEDVPEFLRALTQLRPRCIVVDWHEHWDVVISQISNGTPEVRERKRRIVLPNGDSTEYFLTTKPDPDDDDRVLRGVESVGCGESPRNIMWTSQFRRSSLWFKTGLEACGYSVIRVLEYFSGYGPMRGLVFAPTRL